MGAAAAFYLPWGRILGKGKRQAGGGRNLWMPVVRTLPLGDARSAQDSALHPEGGVFPKSLK